MKNLILTLISCISLLVFIPEVYSQRYECYKPIECAGYNKAGECITFSEEVDIKEEPVFAYIKNKWWNKSELQKITKKIHSSFLLKNKNGSQCIVLIESREDEHDCHACQANIGIVILKMIDGNLESFYDQNNITSLGTWGSAPEAHLEKIGRNNIGIAFNGEEWHQGVNTKYYVLIAKSKGIYREVLSTIIADDGRGIGIEMFNYHWSSEIVFIKGGNERFYDIHIKSQGTKSIDKDERFEIMPFTEEKIYKFRDDKYVLINK